MSEILKLDMHVHTSYSHDGRDPPALVVARAARIGLDGLAITDHNNQDGVGEALDAGREEGITVIPGIEVSCREGHILLYGSPEFELSGERTAGAVLSILRDSYPECIAAVAHPFDFYRSGMGWESVKYDFDAVETVNAHSPLPRGAVLGLCRAIGAGEVGGSDAHSLRSIGKGRTTVSEGAGPILERIVSQGRAEGGFDILGLLPRLVG